eukprot:g45821.t1
MIQKDFPSGGYFDVIFRSVKQCEHLLKPFEEKGGEGPLPVLSAAPLFIFHAQIEMGYYNPHVQPPHDLAVDVLTFLGRYVQLEGGSTDVVDPFGIWTRKWKVKVVLKMDASGNILHLSSIFAIRRKLRLPDIHRTAMSAPTLREMARSGNASRGPTKVNKVPPSSKKTEMRGIQKGNPPRSTARMNKMVTSVQRMSDSSATPQGSREFPSDKTASERTLGLRKAGERWGRLPKLQKSMQELLPLQTIGFDVAEDLQQVKSQQSSFFTSEVSKIIFWSRVHTVEQDEMCLHLFFQTVHRGSSVLSSLKEEHGSGTSSQSDILRISKSFYARLYDMKPTDSAAFQSFLSSIAEVLDNSTLERLAS